MTFRNNRKSARGPGNHGTFPTRGLADGVQLGTADVAPSMLARMPG